MSIHSSPTVAIQAEAAESRTPPKERALDIARWIAQGNELTPLQKIEVAAMDEHDNVFQDIDLNGWMPDGH